MRGIYVHIPFCIRKCGYCDFYSVAGGGEEERDRFPALVEREMDRIVRSYPGEADVPADTVYFGGGTPTVLRPDRLQRLLRSIRARFPVAEDAEISVEANPGTVTADEFARLREGGFNRVSIGVQSFRKETLASLGRIHSVEDVRATHRDARRAGFSSVGIDLIFGNPGQGEAEWLSDLDLAITFLPDHVSAYALSPEPGTPIHGAIGRGEIALPDDDAVARMYADARETLTGAGYRNYEISNFSRPGKECRHNRKYWRREGYLGLGPSAHGLLFPGEEAPVGLRTANPPTLSGYSRALEEGRLPWGSIHACTREDAWKESLIFGLRTSEGVSPASIEKKNGPPPEPVRGAMEKLIGSGVLRRREDRLQLPERYWFISNEVLQRLA
ncbi:MAG TPA: radical SAM family heme chaperone HemW [Candidatus Methylomirabilis sp.]|nr:radical SAM family heme chaperone HemW [Candidatus Methylomirabilis sp.]